jgi:outer membrane protein TolC
MPRLLLLALIWPITAAAQPDESISIEKLVEIAVERSTTMLRARAQKRAADLGEVIAGAPAEWQIQSQFAIDRGHSISGAEGPSPLSADSTHYSASLGISKQLPTGGTLSLSLSGADQSTDLPAMAASAFPTLPTDDVQGSAILSLRQPLLRGFGMGAAVDQHKAALIADQAGYQLAENDAAELRELVTAYWELAYARATVAVRASSVAVANEQLQLTKRMYDRGTVPESAITAARYAVATREEALLRANDDVQSQSLALRKNAGLEIGPDLGDLAPNDELAVDDRAWDVEQTLAIALAHNPRIAAARRGIAIATVDVERTANGRLPQVDLTVGGGLQGDGSDVNSAWTSLTRGSYVVNGALSFRYDLGGAAHANAQAARIQRGTARLDAKDTERDVVTQVIDGVRRMRAAQQRAKVAHVAVELAKTNLATEQSLFRADKSNNVLVFQREQELEEARLLEARAAADSQIALVALEYVTGHVLARFRVEISNRRDRP